MFKLWKPSAPLIQIENLPSLITTDSAKDGEILTDFVVKAVIQERLLPRNRLGLRVRDYGKILSLGAVAHKDAPREFALMGFLSADDIAEFLTTEGTAFEWVEVQSSETDKLPHRNTLLYSYISDISGVDQMTADQIISYLRKHAGEIGCPVTYIDEASNIYWTTQKEDEVTTKRGSLVRWLKRNR